MQEDCECKTILGYIWPLSRWGKGPSQYFQQHCSRVMHKKTLRHLRSVETTVLSSEEFSSPEQSGRGREKENTDIRIWQTWQSSAVSRGRIQHLSYSLAHRRMVHIEEQGKWIAKIHSPFFPWTWPLRDSIGGEPDSQSQILPIPSSLPHLPISSFS